MSDTPAEDAFLPGPAPAATDTDYRAAPDTDDARDPYDSWDDDGERTPPAAPATSWWTDPNCSPATPAPCP
ncbi:hypothetical protein OL239_19145 [Arthrobacter sp. ATA002]|uniref:hypothetical protein n=1 Tax=Arthrobacter sp. ATA002 TaxID=2991715 RepID=UPI0022A6ADE2|nr:hypothetical protein [Arthrobacter sp. ATA002]WAP51811.1 hypothetical protein OL239_19145 [Arthrobacter sp. ATA002]